MRLLGASDKPLRRRSFPNPTMCSPLFFFSSRRRHTRFDCDWSSDVCSSDLLGVSDRSLCSVRQDVRQPVEVDKSMPRIEMNLHRLSMFACGALLIAGVTKAQRSEERRVGKECRSRRSANHETRKMTIVDVVG